MGIDETQSQKVFIAFRIPCEEKCYETVQVSIPVLGAEDEQVPDGGVRRRDVHGQGTVGRVRGSHDKLQGR